MATPKDWDETLNISAEPISTARLKLEPLRVDHARELAPVLDDESLHEFTGGRPLTAAEMTDLCRVRVTERSPDGRERWLNWVIRCDGEPIGYVQATVALVNHLMTADIAWVLASSGQGHGYAKEASGAMVAWLVLNGVTVVRAHIHPQHVASASVARSLGLRPNGEVVDGERRWELRY